MLTLSYCCGIGRQIHTKEYTHYEKQQASRNRSAHGSGSGPGSGYHSGRNPVSHH